MLDLFSLKVLFFYSKHKAELYPEHLPTSEMENFLTIAIVAKDSILYAGLGPGYNSDGCYHHQSQQLIFNYKYV